MTELKFFRGESERIGENVTPITDGYCYLCIDNGKLYFDVVDEGTPRRFCINGLGEYQGVEHSGKLLAVDASGHVAPSDIFMPTGNFTWRDIMSRYTWGDLYGQTE